MGDEEMGKAALVGEESLGSGGNSRGDWGCGDPGSQVGDVFPQTSDRGLVGLGVLEEGAGGDLRDLPEAVGTSPGAEGLQDSEG